MHIVHLETGRHLYGGAQQVLYLLEGLAREGVRSTLVCPPDSAICTAAGAAGVSVQTMPMAGDLDALFGRRFAGWLNTAHAQLLHVHSRRGADTWGGLAARVAGVPAVLSRRVDSADPPLIGTLKYQPYARIICISAQIQRQLQATGVPADKLRIVYSAINAEAFQPRWSRADFCVAFGLPADALAVVCVAQLIARKGHAFLLDAWAAIVAACPRARLVLFGQGPEEVNLRQQVAQLRLQESVVFAGFRQDLPYFLGCADLLVHPALREGLGVCLLEAQAAGLPVVASQVGGIPEAVAAGVSGLLVPPANAVALATSMITLLQDAPRRAALGAAGRAHVAREFSHAAMVSGNLQVYREIL
jgi:glycosyltransferase involved in cell wall biosynthesis